MSREPRYIYIFTVYYLYRWSGNLLQAQKGCAHTPVGKVHKYKWTHSSLSQVCVHEYLRRGTFCLSSKRSPTPFFLFSVSSTVFISSTWARLAPPLLPSPHWERRSSRNPIKRGPRFHLDQATDSLLINAAAKHMHEPRWHARSLIVEPDRQTSHNN